MTAWTFIRVPITSSWSIKFGHHTFQMRPFSRFSCLFNNLTSGATLWTLVYELWLQWTCWRFPVLISNKSKFGSHIVTHINFSNEVIFTFSPLSYNLTSDWSLTVDMWLLTAYQQMRVPTLHLWPNFGWNPSKHVEGRAQMLTCFHNNRHTMQTTTVDKVIPMSVFPAEAGDTKM